MKYTTKINEKKPINFDKIDYDEFIPQFEKFAQLSKDRLKDILSKPASFENTIIGLDNISNELDDLSNIFSLLSMVNKVKKHENKIDTIAERANQISSELGSLISFNQELFAKVEEVYLSAKNLDAEDTLMLKDTYKAFLENGINLTKDKQEKLHELSEEIGKLGLEFDSNVLNDTQESNIYIENINDFVGVSTEVIDMAKELAEEKNYPGYILNINDSTYSEIVTYCHNRKLRELVYVMYRKIGSNEKFCNFPIVKRILQIRKEVANILNKKSHIDSSLEDQMVKSIEELEDLFQNLDKKIAPMKKREIAILNKYALKDNIVLQRWDEEYYQNIEKGKVLSIDTDSLREFFPFKKVWSGLQEMLLKMYNIKFEPANVSVYEKTVMPYYVIDQKNNKNLGIVYLDPYTRPSKEDGAFMMTVVSPQKDQMSVICISSCFPAPSKDGTCLLTIEDVRTLFHEVGHALQALFSETKYESAGGVNVANDYVELASQIMENFVFEPEVLSLISGHYKTNKPLDLKVVQKLQEYNKMFAAIHIDSRLYISKLDLLTHQLDPDQIHSFDDMESFFSNTFPTPYPKGASRVSSFSHIFTSGYDCAMYSYLYSEILDSDCFTIFKDKGVLNPEIAHDFRKEILSTGASRDEKISFESFMKRNLQLDSYLKKYGLI